MGSATIMKYIARYYDGDTLLRARRLLREKGIATHVLQEESRRLGSRSAERAQAPARLTPRIPASFAALCAGRACRRRRAARDRQGAGDGYSSSWLLTPRSTGYTVGGGVVERISFSEVLLCSHRLPPLTNTPSWVHFQS